MCPEMMKILLYSSGRTTPSSVVMHTWKLRGESLGYLESPPPPASEMPSAAAMRCCHTSTPSSAMPTSQARQPSAPLPWLHCQCVSGTWCEL